MKTLLLNAKDPADIETAAQLIKKGGLVAFPTETVYGLGADALNPIAVAKIFEVKKRPTFDPLIVHVHSKEIAATLWEKTPALAQKLMDAFWPGALTIVANKKEHVPDLVTAGLATAALRMPKNKEALAFIEACGTPIAAPSANIYGYTSPTTAQAVMEDLNGAIDAVLDGGDAHIGIESTVVKLEKNEIFILRPGGVTLEDLQKIAKTSMAVVKTIESPGQTESHYAPWTKFRLLEKPFGQCAAEFLKWQAALSKEGKTWPRIGLICLKAPKETPFFETVEVLSADGNLLEAASKLFQAMRKLDKMHLDLIVAEPVTESGIGLGMMDRLRKASGGQTGIQEFFLKN